MADPLVVEMTSGCTELIQFDDQLTYARAVGTLLGCHPHHFVVLPDAGIGWAIVVSPHARECLSTRLGLHHLMRTVSKTMPPFTTPVGPPPVPPDLEKPPF